MKDLLREERQMFEVMKKSSTSTAPGTTETTAATKKKMLWGTRTRLGKDISTALQSIHQKQPSGHKNFEFKF
jgi:hypothetical protein